MRLGASLKRSGKSPETRAEAFGMPTTYYPYAKAEASAIYPISERYASNATVRLRRPCASGAKPHERQFDLRAVSSLSLAWIFYQPSLRIPEHAALNSTEIRNLDRGAAAIERQRGQRTDRAPGGRVVHVEGTGAGADDFQEIGTSSAPQVGFGSDDNKAIASSIIADERKPGPGRGRAKVPLQILALADDMTGALEVGARFAASGIPTAVTTQWSEDAPAVVIDTETRHLPESEAACVVYELARKATAARLIYKKTDSTLRGNIAAELDAVARAFPASPLIYAPAYPVMGRTVRNGHLYVDGVLVTETEFARDPLNPVHESHVQTLLARYPHAAAIRVIDGETDADLDAAARLVTCLAAGPAAFAHAIAKVLDVARVAPPPFPCLSRCVVINGSLHQVSARQIANAQAAGWPTVGPDEIPRDAGWWLLSNGAGIRGIVENRTVDGLVVFGGDTAYAILDALGRPTVWPLGEIVPGVPVSRVHPDLHLITKAGGFGATDILDTIRQALARSRQ
jgi:uncharacterized protein YgbK (DUF1537 family)